MKTTKSKKASSEKKSSSTIQNFFQTDSKGSLASAKSNVKSVYVHALLDKLKSFDEEVASSKESNSEREDRETVVIASTSEPTTNHVEMNKSNRCDACGRADKTSGCDECGKWRTKYEEVKRSHLKLSFLYTELMMKHNDLVEVAKGSVRPNVNCEEKSDGVPQTVSVSDGVPQTVYVSDEGSSVSDDVFTQNEIKCLQCLPLNKKKDSTFVLHCVQYAYKNNTATLTKKTLKGTRARFEIDESGDLVTVKPGKDPLTPEKVQRIQQLFIDRVTKSKCMAGEFGERVQLTNINKLIASAVKNISNKEEPKKVIPNQNADLSL